MVRLIPGKIHKSAEHLHLLLSSVRTELHLLRKSNISNTGSTSKTLKSPSLIVKMSDTHTRGHRDVQH